MELPEARQFIKIGQACPTAKNVTERQTKKMRISIDKMAETKEKRNTQKLSEQDIDLHFLIPQTIGNRS